MKRSLLERKTKLSPTRQLLLEKRLRGENNVVSKLPQIASLPRPQRLPLSYAQQRLWLLAQMGASEAYHIFNGWRLKGALDREALRRGLDRIVARHEALRTTFVFLEGEPVQCVKSAAESRFHLVEYDLSEGCDAQRELDGLVREEAATGFDLEGGPLIRGRLIRIGEEEHALLITMHHIVSDGWSLGVIFRELAVLHAAFVAGGESPLPPLPIRFSDYAWWERDNLQGETLEKPLAYWRDQLAGATALALPTDHPHSSEGSARGATQTRHFPAEIVRELRNLSQREGATLFMTLLAAFQTLLHRYTGQDDIVVGSCVAGRPHLELEKIAGFFVNTIVLRTDTGGQPTFRELLRRTRETVLGAMAHQDLPFEKIVEGLRPDRSPARNPFFQVMFVLQSAASFPPDAGAWRMEGLDFDNGTAKFDLTFSLAENAAGGLGLSLEYRTDLFEGATIARLLDHYQNLLTAAAATPDLPVTDLSLLAPAERRQLLETWSGRRTDYPRDASIGALFREQAKLNPDAPAITGHAVRLTYREVEEKSNRLAHHLRRLGAGPGGLVALCLERTPHVAVTLLAILKTGAAYVSLDPAYPSARLGLMIADSRPVALVTQEHLRPTLDAALAAGVPADARPTILSLEAGGPEIDREPAIAPEVAVPADATAYVCYTSGSTGRPKGVCVPHRGVVRLVRGTDFMDFGPGETFLQFAPVAFDASTLEIWGPLLNGGRLAVFPPGLPSLTELADFVRQQGVTTLFLTTGLFHQMMDEPADRLTGLHQLATGGEVLSPVHAARARAQLPHVRLVNAYGPTENSTITTAATVVAPPAPGAAVPIGRPIANTTVYVLDARLAPVPVGVPGELFTGGDGLASGYLNRPDLTAERFIPHPFDPAPGARLYRTGDLVRWRPDGSLDFLGRADRQVKLRGFRLEMGEIETVLAQQPAVAQALVTVDTPAGREPRLVAYVTGRDGALPDPAEVRSQLLRHLPDFMVPAVIVPLAEIPLKPSGKVDHAALPAPDQGAAAGRPPPVAPRSPIEQALATIWENILHVSPVGVHDSFFELGGHSMAGVRLFAQIEREFGRRLPLASLFESPTIAQLAARLAAPANNLTCSSLVALQPHGTRPPIFFVHGAGGGNLWTYTNLVPHLGPDQPVYALESRGMRGLEEFKRIEDMAAHYLREIQTVQPHGPYFLSGYCFGGNVAYEMARQLRDAGEEVALVALLDSAAANSSYQRLPWWRPDFHARFTANTAYWLLDFLAQPGRERWRYMRRKARQLGRHLVKRLRGRGREVEVESVIDTSLFPEIELDLWKIHLRALADYHAAPYDGAVVLFRTRGHPFLCSFDPEFGWGPLARRGVTVVGLPGSHEQIFMEPHVRELSARFRAALEQAQNHSRATAPSLS
jgi:amino acid adenylation domain-containing protein